MSTIKYIFTSLLVIFLISCEKVVDIDTNTSQERLVVQALPSWEKGTDGNEQVIKLETTSPFFEDTNTLVSGATIIVTASNNTDFVFNEIEPGIYTTNNFVPEFDVDYTLNVTYKDEVFEATDRFFKVPEIEITQSIKGGENDEDPEVTVTIPDFEEEENFYRILILHNRIVNDELTQIDYADFIYTDEFEDGQELSLIYEYSEILPNDIFDISVFGISEKFTTYLDLIGSQADADIGPFASPPVNIKGNIKNNTNPDNYPYGYFSLSEVAKEEYIFQ